MKKNLFLVLLVLGGCVNNEIKEEAPAKTKSVTVWSSDLKLNYDRLTDEVSEVKEREEEVTPKVQEIVREEELPEIEIVEEKRIVPEAGDGELEVILEEDLAKKIVMDESLTKGIEEIRKDIPQDEKKVPLKIVLFLIGIGASLGAYLKSTRKRDEEE